MSAAASTGTGCRLWVPNLLVLSMRLSPTAPLYPVGNLPQGDAADLWPIRPCYFPGCLAAGTKLFGVGVCASLLGVGITNALVAARQVGRWALVGHSDG